MNSALRLLPPAAAIAGAILLAGCAPTPPASEPAASVAAPRDASTAPAAVETPQSAPAGEPLKEADVIDACARFGEWVGSSATRAELEQVGDAKNLVCHFDQVQVSAAASSFPSIVVTPSGMPGNLRAHCDGDTLIADVTGTAGVDAAGGWAIGDDYLYCTDAHQVIVTAGGIGRSEDRAVFWDGVLPSLRGEGADWIRDLASRLDATQ